jgi:hypothetical protein
LVDWIRFEEETPWTLKKEDEMRRTLLSHRSQGLVSLAVFVMLAIFLVPALAGAGDVEKNNGQPVDRPAVLVIPPGHPFPVDSRVVAVVDYPSSSDCIMSGYTGTLYCYDSGDDILPYLVNWDEACGFPQDQVCGRLAPNGWWVGFEEVELLSAGVSGCVTLDGEPVVGAKVKLKQKDEVRQITQTDADGCYQFESVVSGKKFKVTIKGPVVP